MTEQERVETKFGDCEICHEETDVINIIPKHKPNGSLITIACTKCSIEAGMFCQKHKKPHSGFEDEITACRQCTVEIIRENGVDIANAFSAGVLNSPKKTEILQAMDEYLAVSLEITGTSRFHGIATPIVITAQRLRKSTDEILAETFEKGPQVLFPWEN